MNAGFPRGVAEVLRSDTIAFLEAALAFSHGVDEVIGDIHSSERGVEAGAFEDIALQHLDVAPVAAGETARLPGKANDVMACGYKTRYEATADIPGGSGDEDSGQLSASGRSSVNTNLTSSSLLEQDPRDSHIDQHLHQVWHPRSLHLALPPQIRAILEKDLFHVVGTAEELFSLG